MTYWIFYTSLDVIQTLYDRQTLKRNPFFSCFRLIKVVNKALPSLTYHVPAVLYRRWKERKGLKGVANATCHVLGSSFEEKIQPPQTTRPFRLPAQQLFKSSTQSSLASYLLNWHWDLFYALYRWKSRFKFLKVQSFFVSFYVLSFLWYLPTLFSTLVVMMFSYGELGKNKNKRRKLISNHKVYQWIQETIPFVRLRSVLWAIPIRTLTNIF